MGGINAMAQYQSYFGLEGSANKTSIVFGIYTVYVSDFLCSANTHIVG